MVKVRELLVGLSLLMATGVVAAGPLKPGYDIKAKETDCPDATAWMEKVMSNAGADHRFAPAAEQDNISGPEDSMIEEYLSFHAQAREENGQFPLMPWPALRAPAN
jgi:hypothetical protein